MTDITKEIEKIAEDIGVDRRRSIGEVAKALSVKTHVIRFWEENFSQIKPEIGSGGRRYYYNDQIKVLKRIKKFLYEEGYTIAGLQKLLKRRKDDEYKEEDLDVIIHTNNTQDQEETKLEIEDFLDKKIDVKIGQQLNPKAKMIDFADIRIVKIHPKIQEEINQKIENIRSNLKALKSTTNKNF